MLRGESLLKKECFKYSDGNIEECFIPMGLPKNLAKTLMYISQIDDEKLSKKELFGFYDEDYNEDDYNVFTYDTLRYPPGSTPHKTLN